MREAGARACHPADRLTARKPARDRYRRTWTANDRCPRAPWDAGGRAAAQKRSQVRRLVRPATSHTLAQRDVPLIFAWGPRLRRGEGRRYGLRSRGLTRPQPLGGGPWRRRTWPCGSAPAGRIAWTTLSRWPPGYCRGRQTACTECPPSWDLYRCAQA